jgi:hypothetical protein
MGALLPVRCSARSAARTTDTSEGRIMGSRSGRKLKNDDMMAPASSLR